MALFNPATALRAQLNSGYKNADYALSEIIDNSIEAGAKNIDLLIIQSQQQQGTRTVWRTNKVVVLDDGHGMPEGILNKALTFGCGTHENATLVYSNDRGKMGKFGYGLPNASVSQANEVTVWSWTKPVDNEGALPLHTCLNVKKILDGTETEASPATEKKISRGVILAIESVGAKLSQKGTIVCWSDTERLHWKRATSLLGHLEKTLGRIYRKYIAEEQINIYVSILCEEQGEIYPLEEFKRKKLKAFDPLFLDPNAYKPEVPEGREIPSGVIAVPFVPKNLPSEIEVNYKGNKAKILFKFSTITGEARGALRGGGSKFGKLCQESSGVSICRAGREIELSRRWFTKEDTRNRWVRAEVDFPPALDEIFGVTNNKQSATILTEFDLGDWRQFVETYTQERSDLLGTSDKEAMPQQRVFDELVASQDTRWVILEVNRILSEATSQMFDKVEAEGERKKRGPRNTVAVSTSTEAATYIADTNRVKEGGESSAFTPEEAQKAAKKYVEELNNHNSDPDPKMSDELVKKLEEFFENEKKQVEIIELPIEDTDAFFSMKREKGRIIISLNTNNKWVELVCDALDSSSDEEDGEMPMSYEEQKIKGSVQSKY